MRSIFTFTIAALILTACFQAPIPPTSTPFPSITPIPISTVTPTVLPTFTPTLTPVPEVAFVKVEDVKSVDKMMDGSTPAKRAAIAKTIQDGLKDGSIEGFDKDVVQFVPTPNK